MTEKEQPIIRMTGIEKGFYGVPVLKGIDFDLYAGECVGLIGENGAGKSTLIKILCGAYSKDGGKIFVDGREVEFKSVKDAQEVGIRTIYQELSLFSTMTVEQNIFINDEITASGKGFPVEPIKVGEMRDLASKILREQLSTELDVKKRVSEIPFSQRQLVEIARALHSNGRVIIMDEPTTALENKEKENLFRIIEELKRAGKAIVFISHHLDEIMRVCDRTVVLRDGERVMNDRVSDITIDDIIVAMVGKNVENHYPRTDRELGETVVKVEGITDGKNYRDISFDVRESEIVGIVGLAGCGKNEILRTLFGLKTPEKGTITFKGKELRMKSTKDAIKNRIAFLPAERKTEGIFSIHSVATNTSIAALDRIKNGFALSPGKEAEITEDYGKRFGIKMYSTRQGISRLSGGNQQKVMLARWFMTEPDLLLLEEPTRGIDINAKVDVYNLIMDYAGKGKPVIMVSSEEEEVLGICDRIVVIHNGRVNTILDARNTSVEEIKRYSVQSTVA